MGDKTLLATMKADIAKRDGQAYGMITPAEHMSIVYSALVALIDMLDRVLDRVHDLEEPEHG